MSTNNENYYCQQWFERGFGEGDNLDMAIQYYSKAINIDPKF